MFSSESLAKLRQGGTLRMSFDEFLAWGDEDVFAEWVNGKVSIYPSPGTRHQQIVGFVSVLLHTFAETFDFGEVFILPTMIKLSPQGSGRVPDVFFIAQDRAWKIGEYYFDGPPDLIIEVVSDDSVSRDRADKFEEYEDAGVKEYWIIDPRPRRRRADFYQLGADGKYQPVPVGADGRYRSQVLPGFWIKVGWLWEEPLPKLQPTLNEIMGK